MKKLGHGHIHGQCIVSDAHKLIHVYIPKNASCSLRKYLIQNRQGYESNYFELTEAQKRYWTFCIFRDPVLRFTSAINTILRDKETNIYDMCDSTLEHHIANMTDTHLVKQCEFIHSIRIDLYFTIENVYVFFRDLPLLNRSIPSQADNTILKRVTSDKVRKVYFEDQLLYDKISISKHKIFQ
jgi:hypothetical protein